MSPCSSGQEATNHCWSTTGSRQQTVQRWSTPTLCASTIQESRLSPWMPRRKVGPSRSRVPKTRRASSLPPGRRALRTCSVHSSRCSPPFQPGLTSSLLVATSHWPTSAPRVSCRCFFLGATTLRGNPRSPQSRHEYCMGMFRPRCRCRRLFTSHHRAHFSRDQSTLVRAILKDIGPRIDPRGTSLSKIRSCGSIPVPMLQVELVGGLGSFDSNFEHTSWGKP